MAVSDAELLATIKKTLPLVNDDTLRLAVGMFRQICNVNSVVMLRATRDDYAIISQRIAIGWDDDRP